MRQLGYNSLRSHVIILLYQHAAYDAGALSYTVIEKKVDKLHHGVECVEFSTIVFLLR